MFYLFVACLLPFFTFASPTLVDFITTMSSNDENVGNRLVFCHFMASYTFITFIALSNYKTLTRSRWASSAIAKAPATMTMI